MAWTIKLAFGIIRTSLTGSLVLFVWHVIGGLRHSGSMQLGFRLCGVCGNDRPVWESVSGDRRGRDRADGCHGAGRVRGAPRNQYLHGRRGGTCNWSKLKLFI